MNEWMYAHIYSLIHIVYIYAMSEYVRIHTCSYVFMRLAFMYICVCNVYVSTHVCVSMNFHQPLAVISGESPSPPGTHFLITSGPIQQRDNSWLFVRSHSLLTSSREREKNVPFANAVHCIFLQNRLPLNDDRPRSVHQWRHTWVASWLAIVGLSALRRADRLSINTTTIPPCRQYWGTSTRALSHSLHK